jgi:hypothetical protein
MVALDAVVGVAVGTVPGRWQQSSSTAGYSRAWSLVTSAGVTLVVPMTRWKNLRAAPASRRGETNTPMTCPN